MNPKPLTEGTVLKGGQNPPVDTSNRPRAPRGSGEFRELVESGQVIQALVRCVVEREREECAKIADNARDGLGGFTDKAAVEIARAIRARGQ